MVTFAELMQGRHFILSGEINDSTASGLLRWLGSWHSTEEEALTTIIMTPGGSVTAAFAIHDALQAMSAIQPINTVAVGKCESAGNIVLSAVPRDRRYTLPNTRFMIHAAMTMVNGRHTTCDPTTPAEVEEVGRLTGFPDLDETYRLQDMIVDTLVGASHLSEPRVREMMRRNTYFGAAAAQEYGLVGSIIS